MAITKYRTYELSELLAEFEGKRGQSQIIDELCTRLEVIVFPEAEMVRCPVCEANFHVHEGAICTS